MHPSGVAHEKAKTLLIDAQRSLEEGRFDDARRSIEDAFALHPEDEKVVELYQQILLADGVRLTRVARDLRRDEIRALEKRERGSHRDSDDVREAFLKALESFDKVLMANPRNSKALMLKSGTLDRMDRPGNREEVLALFDQALAIHPDNEELLYARGRILGPCSHCGGPGFCADCQGSGEVSGLFVRRRCPSCKGSGVCVHCGLF